MGDHLQLECAGNLELYCCTYCDINFDTTIHLRKHIDEEHFQKKDEACSNYQLKYYTCKNCSFDTYSSLQWIKHRLNGCRKNKIKSFEKILIKKEYNNKIFKHLNDKDEKWLQCEKYAFKSKWRGKHFFAKDSNKEWHQCEECMYKTKLKSNLLSHLQAKHERTNSYQCVNCEYKTISKSYFQNHLLSKHNIVEDLHFYQCEKCEYKTKWKSYLQNHFSAKHTNQKVFECKKCTFKTTDKSSFQAHIRGKHVIYQDENWFKCEKCPYKSEWKNCLTRHILLKHC